MNINRYTKKNFSENSSFKELSSVCITCGRCLRTSHNMQLFRSYIESGYDPIIWSNFLSSDSKSWCCKKHFLELL